MANAPGLSDAAPEARPAARAAAIRIDVRERTLAAALAALGAEVSVEALPVADAIVDGKGGEFFVERKKVADLAASIKDGRLRDQRARLVEAAAGDPHRAVVVVEGKERLSGGSGGISGESLWGAVVNTCVRDRMVVLRTADEHETALVLLKLARGAWASGGPEAAAGCVAKAYGAMRTPNAVRRARPGGLAACMLEAIPGMGSKRAEAIATYLAADGRGGLAGVFRGDARAAQAAIAGVVVGGRKVGPALAARVSAALCGAADQ